MRRDEFESLRRGAFAVAYRMLGSVGDAEDVVQEGLLRLHRARSAGERIESPRAYLSTVVSRLSLDQLRSARVRRETYVGEWLPEPLLTSDEDDPAHRVELADSVSLAFLVVLESLSPEQRAAFLLHDVFDEPFSYIADIIDTTEANARRLAQRARRHVDQHRPRFDVSRRQAEELADRFFTAARDGELEPLEAMLAHDVVLHADSGGRAPAPGRPVYGRQSVARTLVAGLRAAGPFSSFTARRVVVNGQPGALLCDEHGALGSVIALDIVDGQIQGISSIVNPDKLGHLGPVADLHALLRGPVKP